MKRRILSTAAGMAVLIGGAALLGTPAAQAGTGGVVSAYTLVTPTSVSKTKLQVRAVIASGINCPNLVLKKGNGSSMSLSMKMRSPGATTGAAFASVRACKANIPKTTSGITSARVGSSSVPFSLPAKFDKIVMLGDTGCRVDDGTTPDIQDCSKTSGTNPADYWPLSRNSVAIAKEKPDLTVFTGDFFYREDPCPAGFEARCGGSPPPIDSFRFNDTDYGWMADVFIPMAPLFEAAPILAVRGNHEQCDRGGNGWFLFFEVSTALGPDACAPPTLGGATVPNISPSWAFDAPITNGRSLRIVAVDSAYGRNFDITSWVDTQRPQYEAAQQLSTAKQGRESWLLAHRPMFGVEPIEEAATGLLPYTSIDQTAASYGLLGNYQMIIGSHVHVSQVVKVPNLPVQMVVGNGSSKPDIASESSYQIPAYGPLAKADGTALSPSYTPYEKPSYLWTKVKYGYTVMKPGSKAKQWTAIQRDYTGKTFATCSLVKKDMTCTNSG